MVITGGLATRFYPISKVIPKPLLPVGNRSVIDYVMDSVKPLNMDVWLLVNAYASSFQSWARVNGAHVHLTPVGGSEELGGVAADLYDLAESLEFPDLFLTWGNMICTADYRGFLAKYDGKPLLGIFDVGSLETVKRYGVAVLSDSRLVEYREKPDNPASTLTYMGLAVLPSHILKMIPQFLQFIGHTHHRFGEYLNWLVEVKGIEVKTAMVDGDWMYLDWPDSYERMWRWYLGKSTADRDNPN